MRRCIGKDDTFLLFSPWFQKPIRESKRTMCKHGTVGMKLQQKDAGNRCGTAVPGAKTKQETIEKIVWKELVRTQRRAHIEIVPLTTGEESSAKARILFVNQHFFRLSALSIWHFWPDHISAHRQRKAEGRWILISRVPRLVSASLFI